MLLDGDGIEICYSCSLLLQTPEKRGKTLLVTQCRADSHVPYIFNVVKEVGREKLGGEQFAYFVERLNENHFISFSFRS